jgi:hypothetical protein
VSVVLAYIFDVKCANLLREYMWCNYSVGLYPSCGCFLFKITKIMRLVVGTRNNFLHVLVLNKHLDQTRATCKSLGPYLFIMATGHYITHKVSYYQ